MMENNEIQMLHNINKQVTVLIEDFNKLVGIISELTNMVYDREIESVNGIKLRSHM